MGLGVRVPGDHVLALGVDEKFAIKTLIAGGRVASKGHAGSAVFPQIAENHRLNIDRRAPIVRDLVELAIGNCPIVIPRSEHRANGTPQLFEWVFGESFTRSDF